MTIPDPDRDFLHAADRFAFIPRRIHSFDSSGNAYDATQCDERIGTGDTLLILPEKVVAVAHTWPFAITAEAGRLHQLRVIAGDTLDTIARTFSLSERDLEAAIGLADALGFALDPSLVGMASERTVR
jgi:hypothetical protein